MSISVNESGQAKQYYKQKRKKIRKFAVLKRVAILTVLVRWSP